MITIRIDIRHDSIDKGTHFDYQPEFIGIIDKEEELIETKIYNFMKELKENINDK